MGSRNYYHESSYEYNPQGGSYSYASLKYAVKPRRSLAARIVTVVALLVFFGALAVLGYIGYTYWTQQNAYDRLAEENFSVGDPDTITLADFKVNWDALRAINPDVVGWIYVPGTPVSYPIAHRPGNDWYYLTNNFSGEYDPSTQFGAEYGSIFLSGINASNMRDQVNLIYGHNMLNGEMFSVFSDFTDSSVFNEYRYAYVLTPEGNYLLESFAVNQARGWASDIPFANFETDAEFDEYLQTRLNESLVEPSPPAPPYYKISQVFALSTCETNNDAYRVVTFYYVKEFLPEGSKYVQANSLIKKEDVEGVQESLAARTQ